MKVHMYYRSKIFFLLLFVVSGLSLNRTAAAVDPHCTQTILENCCNPGQIGHQGSLCFNSGWGYPEVKQLILKCATEPIQQFCQGSEDYWMLAWYQGNDPNAVVPPTASPATTPASSPAYNTPSPTSFQLPYSPSPTPIAEERCYAFRYVQLHLDDLPTSESPQNAIGTVSLTSLSSTIHSSCGLKNTGEQEGNLRLEFIREDTGILVHKENITFINELIDETFSENSGAKLNEIVELSSGELSFSLPQAFFELTDVFRVRVIDSYSGRLLGQGIINFHNG